MAQYDGSIRINTNIITKNAQVQLATLENRIVKTADKIAALKSKMELRANTKEATQEYKDIQQYIDSLSKELDKISIKLNRMRNEGLKGTEEYRKTKEEFIDIRDSIKQAKNELQGLVDSGKAFTLGSDTQEYANLGQQLQYAESDLAVLNQRRDELISRNNIVRLSFEKLGVTVKKAFSSISSWIKKATLSMFGFGKSAKGVNGILNSGFKNILKYGLGIRSFYALINKFRTAVKQGFTNLAQYSEPVNASLSSLKSSLTQLKNSLATAFAPILTTIAPALTTLINLASRAATAVGMLIAALTGQKTFTKATDVQEKFADSLGGTAKAAKDANKQLSSLDTLNNLTTNDSDGGGGGGANIDDMFETVDVSSKISEFAEMLKKAWENADFTEIGQILGKKLTNALQNIPWNDIQEVAKKIGKSLATFLNGFISPQLFGQVGSTVAQSLNTAIYTALAFGENFDFKNLGNSIATGINKFFQTFDFDALAKTIKTWIQGGLDAAITLFQDTDFKTIGEKIGGFLADLNLGEYLDDIAKLIWEAIKGAFSLLAGLVEEAPLETALIAGFAILKFTGLGSLIVGKIAESIITAIAGSAFVAKLATAVSTIGTTLVTAFTTDLPLLFGAGTFAEIAVAVVGGLAAALVVAFAGWKFGNWLYENNIFGIGDLANHIVEDMGLGDIAVGVIDAFEEMGKDGVGGFFKACGENLKTSAKWLKKNVSKVWDKIKTGVSDAIKNTKKTISKTLDEIKKSWKEKWDEIKKKVSDIWDDIKNAVPGGVNKVRDAISGKMEDMKKPWKDAWEKIKAIVSDAWENIKNAVPSAIDNIKSAISSKIEDMKKPWVDAWDNVKTIVSDAWESVKKSIPSAIDNIKSAISDKIEDMKQPWVDAWDNVKTIVSDAWESVKKSIPSAIDNIKSAISDKIEDMKQPWVDAWDSIKKKVSDIWEEIKNAVPGGVNKVRDAISGKMEDMKKPWKDAWDKIEGKVSEVWKNIKKGIPDAIDEIGKKFSTKKLDEMKKPWMTAWGKIEDKVNKVMDNVSEKVKKTVGELNLQLAGLGKAFQNVADKILDAGKKAIGNTSSSSSSTKKSGASAYNLTNISTPDMLSNIPRLATGTVIPANREFLAVLGDQKHGTNIEAPLDTIKQANKEAVLDVLSELGVSVGNNKSSGNETFVFQVDGKTFFEITRKEAQRFFNRTGYSPFPI